MECMQEIGVKEVRECIGSLNSRKALGVCAVGSE